MGGKHENADGTKKEKGKKVKSWTLVDQCFLACLVCGAVPLLISMVPVVYWRLAQQNSSLGLRFPSHRMMSPLTISDQMGKGIMWARLQRTICEKSRLYNSPDPFTAIASLAVMAYPKASSLGGCATWAACKAHMISRCNTYRTFHMVGIFFTILVLVAILCACGSAFIMQGEGGQHDDVLRKMKTKAREKAIDKEKEQKTKTVIAAAMSFVLSLVAVVAWICCSSFGLKALQKQSFYPYLYMDGPGAALAIFGVTCFFIAFILSIVRNKKTEVSDPEPEGAGGTDDQGGAYPQDYAAPVPQPGPYPAGQTPPPPPF